MLELHRSQSECAGCHAKIDPLGFAMENYDAIGRWRVKDGKFAIDAFGRISLREVIEGPVALKDHLLQQKKILLEP